MQRTKNSRASLVLPVVVILGLALSSHGQNSVAVNLTGTVTDSAGTPISGAVLKLEHLGLTATSAANGTFAISNGASSLKDSPSKAKLMGFRDGTLFIDIGNTSWVQIWALGIKGEVLGQSKRWINAGTHALNLPSVPTGLCFFKIVAGGQVNWLSGFSVDGNLRNVTLGIQSSNLPASLAKKAATPMYDVLVTTMAGYQSAYVNLSTSDSTGMKIRMLKEGSAKFSFFVTSMKALIEISKNDNGFGGDFKFGETGAGAGLRGADKICATIAERSMPGSSVKGWRAFLSVTSDAYGKQVDAISRVGEGPWYDRNGRLLAPKKSDLLNTRPMNGDATIQNDLPNENGIGNHTPVPGQPSVDNHHTMTGSNATGTLQSASSTCKDWTTNVHSTENGKPTGGFSWPRGMGGGNSGSNWISSWSSPGCAAGIEVVDGGGPTQTASQGGWIGGGGGYGGFYCFALNP